MRLSSTALSLVVCLAIAPPALAQPSPYGDEEPSPRGATSPEPEPEVERGDSGADSPGAPDPSLQVSDDDLFATPSDAAAADAAVSDDEGAEKSEEGSGDLFAKDEPPDDDDDSSSSWTDDLSIEWGAVMRSDLRFRFRDRAVGNWYDRRVLTAGVDRNENLIGLRLTAGYGDVTAKADIDFVAYGFSQDVQTLADLSQREKINPYRFEIHRLYIQSRNLGLDGFDLTVGQQLVYWGVGDQFNPTNNLNADDLEDVLFFGQQQGNFMVKADYWFTPQWSMSGVLVPIFLPALLPRSGALQVARVDRLPLVSAPVRHRLAAEQATTQIAAGYPTVVDQVNVVLPEKDFNNMQVGFRVGGSLWGQDLSFSYYNGRTDFPVPFRNETTQRAGSRCNPDDPQDCINGVLATNVSLHYPRMYVYGFNMTGELPWLEDLSPDLLNSIGYRIEAALIVPEASTLELVNGDLDLGLATIPAGEYDYDGDGVPGGRQPKVVASTPFAKWTVGLDYTFNKYVYLNAQWVHGLADEYGAGDWITQGYAVRTSTVDSDDQQTVLCALTQDGTRCAREVLRPRIGDYLVTGLDFRLLDQKMLVRAFTILDLSGVWFAYYDADREAPNRPIALNRVLEFHGPFTSEGFGMIIYPEVGYNFGNGLELSAGTLLQLGKEWGKFGDPASGGSLAWSRAKFSY